MSAAAGLPLALTIGEPAGIGPDLTLAVWRRRVELDVPAFYLIGDADFLRSRARALGLDVPLSAVTSAEAVAAFRAALEVRTREAMPADWATTQNNLGTALQLLGERECYSACNIDPLAGGIGVQN